MQRNGLTAEEPNQVGSTDSAGPTDQAGSTAPTDPTDQVGSTDSTDPIDQAGSTITNAAAVKEADQVHKLVQREAGAVVDVKLFELRAVPVPQLLAVVEPEDAHLRNKGAGYSTGW